MPLDLDVNTADFRRWTSMYRPTGNGIPMIFIVSAKGEAVFNQSGAPQGDGLRRLLEQGIEQTGGPKEVPSSLSPQLQRQLDQVARRAKTLMEQDKLDQASAAVGAVLKKMPAPLPAAASEEEAAPDTGHKEFDEVVDALSAKAAAELKAAADEASRKPLASAIALARVKRLFEPLPAIKTQLDEAMKGAADGDPEIWRQATMIDRARAYQESGSARPALAGYQRVVEAYPGTEAAEYCQARIAELGVEASSTPSTASPPATAERTWRDATGKFSVVASLVSFDGAVVRLKARDGRVIDVPLEKLDAASQASAKSLQSPSQP